MMLYIVSITDNIVLTVSVVVKVLSVGLPVQSSNNFLTTIKAKVYNCVGGKVLKLLMMRGKSSI